MQLKRKLALLVLAVVATACSTSDSKKSMSKMDFALKEVEIGDNEEPNQAAGFVNHLMNRSLIPLETDSNFFIGHCNKIRAYDSKLFVLDRKLSSVNVFDLKGKHLFTVGKIGSGPGEFLRLDDMELDTINHSILLWSNDDMSIFKYKIGDGEFIGRSKMPFFGTRFGLLNDKYLFYVDYNIQKGDDPKNLLVTDTDGNIEYSFFPFQEEKAIMSISYSGFLQRNAQGYLYAHALSDTIYQISKDFNFYPKYHFNLGSNSWPAHFNIFDHQEYVQKGLEYSVLFTPVMEGSGYLFFNFAENKKIKKGFLNTNSGKIYTSDSFIEQDIDFNLFNTPIGMLNDSTFISAIYPDRVFAMKNKYDNFDELLKGSDPFLFDALKSLKEEDNPILMIYSMKH